MTSVAATLWFFYLAWGPIVTVGGVIVGIKLGAGKMQALPISLAVTAALALIAGPVMTSVGPMPWWCANLLDGHQAHETFGLWLYAVACLAVQVLGSLLWGLSRSR